MVDENGGVVIPRWRELYSVLMNLVNGSDKKVGELTETAEGGYETREKTTSRRNPRDESKSLGSPGGTGYDSCNDVLEETVAAYE